MCENYSLTHICSSCQELFLSPSLYKRKLSNGIEVISFYKYSEIKDLLHTKHTDLGFYIYKILAQRAFKTFSDTFELDYHVASLAIDDHARNGYSHTAILNKALKSKTIKPLFNKLRAKNPISYAGKSKEFRIMNPREFTLHDIQEQKVIVVDDIITTGTTLNEAIQLLKQNKKEVLFCLTLADVSQK